VTYQKKPPQERNDMEKMHYDRILNILAQSNKWELYEQLKGTQGMNNAILLDNERCKTDKLRKERDALKRQLQMNKHPISITHDRELEKEAEQLRKERDELKEELNQHKTVLSHCNFGGNMPIKNKLSIVAENKRLNAENDALLAKIDELDEELEALQRKE